MCWISGIYFFGTDTCTSQAVLERMTRAGSHRGPNGLTLKWWVSHSRILCLINLSHNSLPRVFHLRIIGRRRSRFPQDLPAKILTDDMSMD